MISEEARGAMSSVGRRRGVAIASISAVFLTAFVLPSCGGNGSGDEGQPKPQASSSPESNRPPPVARGTQGDRRPRRARGEERPSPKRAGKRRVHAGKPRTRQEALRRLSPELRPRAIAALAPGVVVKLGYTGAHVTSDAHGRLIRVAVPRSQACAGGPRGEARMVRGLKRTLPFVREVTVTIEGSAFSLSGYAAGNCKPLRVPSSRGRVVFEQNGAGFLDTKPFKIRTRRWTLEFANYGNFIQIFILRGKKLLPMVARRAKPGGSRKTVRGRGTFSLKIGAAGSWTVRVRELS